MGEECWIVKMELRRGRSLLLLFSVVWSGFWGLGFVKMDLNVEMYVDVIVGVDVGMNSGSVTPVSPGL